MTRNFARAITTLFLWTLASCDRVQPLEPGNSIPADVINGVYLLSAPGASTYPDAWGGEGNAVKFEGILTLDQDPLDRSKLIGTVSKFGELDSDVTEWIDGIISGSIDARGALILEIKAPARGLTWTGRGIVLSAGARISGQWQSSSPAAGAFIAHRSPTH